MPLGVISEDLLIHFQSICILHAFLLGKFQVVRIFCSSMELFEASAFRELIYYRQVQLKVDTFRVANRSLLKSAIFCPFCYFFNVLWQNLGIKQPKKSFGFSPGKIKKQTNPKNKKNPKLIPKTSKLLTSVGSNAS